MLHADEYVYDLEELERNRRFRVLDQITGRRGEVFLELPLQWEKWSYLYTRAQEAPMGSGGNRVVFVPVTSLRFFRNSTEAIEQLLMTLRSLPDDDLSRHRRKLYARDRLAGRKP